jgi:hypothetical protein
MVLASIFFAGQNVLSSVMLYPMAICATCIVTSIIGTFFVKLGSDNSIMGALYKGLWATSLLSVIGLGGATSLTIGWGKIGEVAGQSITGWNLFFCGLVGLAVTGLIVWITEYYTATGKRPVVSIAQASVTMHSASNRKESRGAHAHEDFPDRNDGEWMKHTASWFDGWGGKGGAVKLDYRPVHEYTLTDDVEYIKPKKRVY